jgi:Tfp pilus assembly protein PilF
VERIRRNYSEASYRQAAFQLDQLRAMRMAMLQPTQRAIEYTQLGREYIKQGLFPEAETQIANALSADPKSADARAALAELREASHNPAEARQEAHNSLTLKPNVAALLVLAQLDLNDQQLKAAADDVSAALHIDPHDSRAIAMKLVLQQRGQAVQ